MNTQTTPEPRQDLDKVLQLIKAHPELNLLPLIEFVVEDEEPEYLESFCNETIYVVSDLLREEKQSHYPERIMRIIQQLHNLREAIRSLRGAPSWP